MDPNKPQAPKNPRQSVGIYLAVILVVMLLVNAFLLPTLRSRSVHEVDYGTFLQMVESKKVSKVQMSYDQSELLFVATDEKGNEALYKTGAFPDSDLVNRLSEYPEIQFTREAPQKNSFLMNFLLTWVFPTLILMLPMIFLMRFMQKKMGGNSMMFGMGKSGAKMYVSSQTGVKFEDVAGDEEAKEALQEIVDFCTTPQNTIPSVQKCPKAFCWWALRARVKP